MNRCVYCGAQTGGDLDNTLAKLLECANCRADIAMQGEWTGVGLVIVHDLMARFGLEAIREAEKCLLAARNGGAAR